MAKETLTRAERKRLKNKNEAMKKEKARKSPYNYRQRHHYIPPITTDSWRVIEVCDYTTVHEIKVDGKIEHKVVRHLSWSEQGSTTSKNKAAKLRAEIYQERRRELWNRDAYEQHYRLCVRRKSRFESELKFKQRMEMELYGEIRSQKRDKYGQIMKIPTILQVQEKGNE